MTESVYLWTENSVKTHIQKFPFLNKKMGPQYASKFRRQCSLASKFVNGFDLYPELVSVTFDEKETGVGYT